MSDITTPFIRLGDRNDEKDIGYFLERGVQMRRPYRQQDLNATSSNVICRGSSGTL